MKLALTLAKFFLQLSQNLAEGLPWHQGISWELIGTMILIIASLLSIGALLGVTYCVIAQRAEYKKV